MEWYCDRTGFPYLHLPGAGLAVGLWPVTKAQFERYLAEPEGPGDEWYDQLLSVNARASWRHPDLATREGLFLTGAWPAETERFARWLGPTFRLPSEAEWRAVDREVAALSSASKPSPTQLATKPNLHPAALALTDWLTHRLHPFSWPRFTLLEDGILEWVRRNDGIHGAYGRVRTGFFDLILNPQHHEPVRLQKNARHRAFGFRLVRTFP